MSLQIELTEAEQERLTQVAAELGVSAERLVAHLVRRHLEVTTPGRTAPTNDDFAYALCESVRENEELYRRLAQ
jgi:hypothetical protein